ncbi:nuclear pore complex protein Nup153 isoform X2 [Battus philenor]|uniref:nuclear pore complex protein Nup153 isoform X2 n=1 Tax=Battus philenor TaxID=42288 RepID=UPI0035D09A28
MDNATPKNRKKRLRSLQETSNSFVQNVSNAVSYYLPSLAKWFSSPTSSNANGSSQRADGTDSSSEEETAESSLEVVPPPSKRMCYNVAGKSNHFGQPDVNYSTSTVDSSETPVTTQSPSNKNSFKRETNYLCTPIQSVIKEVPNDKIVHDYMNTTYKSQYSLSYTTSSVSKKRKSLFDMLSNDTPKKDKRDTSLRKDNSQDFKPSLLASPFYSGKTTYGGAAARYMNQANTRLFKTTVINQHNNSDVNIMSQSTKEIMDLLEHYPSPLSEARRISQYITPRNQSNSDANSYMTQELHVPSIASILTLKRKSRLMDTTKTARQLIASHSSTSSYPYYPKPKTESLSATGSVKNYTSKITKNKEKTKLEANCEPIEPIELPTAVLEIDPNNMPKFNLSAPKSFESSKSASNNIPIAPLGVKEIDNLDTKEQKVCEPKSTADTDTFKFSTPVAVSKDTTLSLTIPKFMFDKPQQHNEEIKENKAKSQTAILNSNSTTKSDTKAFTEIPKEWKCSDCWVNNKADTSNCVCCSAKKPTDQNKTTNNCSNCNSETNLIKNSNLCSKCEEAQKNNSNKLLSMASSENWKCSDCWVSNDQKAEKCVCCGAKNPKHLGTENKSKENELEWKCADCWIKNKSSVNKCIACGGVKPDSKLSSKLTSSPATDLTSSSSFKISDNTFKNIVDAQTNKWQCPFCLVNNENDKSKCICCGAERRNKEENKFKNFTFSANANSFKFGIDPEDQCKDSNKEKEAEKMTVNEECETNNNTLAKTTFNFGIPVNKTEDKKPNLIGDNLEKESTVQKLNFNFGIPTQITQDASSGSALLECSSKVQETAKISHEKPQEVPSVELKLQALEQQALNSDDVPKNSTFISPLPSVIAQKPLQPVSANISQETMMTDKNLPFKGLITQTTTSDEANKPNTFTFPQTDIKLVSDMFNTSPVTGENASTAINSLIPTSANKTSPFFKNSSVNPSSSSNTLFQKIDPIPMFQIPATSASTESTTSLSASTKMFNFGNNGMSSLSQTEKPQFNFSFGNIKKSEGPQIFSAAFGQTASSDELNTTNKFTLIPANTAGNSLALPGNTLGNLTGGNPLISNNLPGNNGLSTGNTLGVSENNSLGASKGIKTSSTSGPPTRAIFGEPAQKQNMWSNANSTGNFFVSNTTTNSLQQAPTFTFGMPSAFDANNTGSIFGSNTSNVFSLQNQISNVPSMFTNSPQNPSATNMFGNPQSTSTPAPTGGVFGNNNMSAANNFNVVNPTPVPSFETISQNPVPTPSFNFGTQQHNTGGVFGFGQQSSQPFQSSVYNFGSNQSTPQFSMGSSHSTVRRVRKAVRRTTQR